MEKELVRKSDELYLGEFTEAGISRIAYQKIRMCYSHTNAQGIKIFKVFVPKNNFD